MACPSPDWAARVFPDLPAAEQVSQLWEAIFAAVRADLEDPVTAWNSILNDWRPRPLHLTTRSIKHCTSSLLGTDLTVELPEGHIWAQAGSVNEQGTPFVANIPTEEVFTAPAKHGVNGTVSSTKPLSYGGSIIDRFSLTFENGRIIDFHAEEGQDTLERLISMDEGSHYLAKSLWFPSIPRSLRVVSCITLHCMMRMRRAILRLAVPMHLISKVARRCLPKNLPLAA